MSAPGLAAAAWPKNPFRLLAWFQPGETLFGRDGDLTLMKARLASAGATLLFAPSGAGKTSFLNAKVIPELEKDHLVCYHRQWADRRPPLELVLDSILQTFGVPAEGSLAEQQSRLEGVLRERVPRPPEAEAAFDPEQFLRRQAEKPKPLVLILDQFEEAFQYHAHEAHFEALIVYLSRLVGQEGVRLVFSMREEFLGELSVFDNRVPDLFGNYYRLKNPTRAEAEDIIRQTCRAATPPIQADGNALKLLVRDLSKVERSGPTLEYVERGFVPLPYLQIACHRLWQRQRERGATGAPKFPEAYEEGDSARLLRDFCDEQLGPKNLNLIQRSLVARAFDLLVTRKGAKMAYELSSLREFIRAPRGLLKNALDRISTPPTQILHSRPVEGDAWYELYHDVYGPIVNRWNERFRSQRRKIWAALGVIPVLLLVYLYWVRLPRQYITPLERAEPIGVAWAADCFRHLESVIGYGPKARSLWAAYWERWAIRHEAAASREAAFLAWLNAINADPGGSGERRRRAQLLVGPDWPLLVSTYNPGQRIVNALFSSGGEAVLTETPRGSIVWDTLAGSPKGSWFERPRSPLAGYGENLAIPTSGFASAARFGFLFTGQGRFWRPGGQFVDSPDESFTAAELSPSGRLMVTTNANNMKASALWDTGSGVPQRLKAELFPAPRATAFSADDRLVAMADSAGKVRVWNTQSGAPVCVPGLAGEGARLVRFGARNANLLLVGDSGRVQVWSVDNCRAMGEAFRIPKARVTLLSDGFTVSAINPFAGAIEFWDGRSGKYRGAAARSGGEAFSPGADVLLERGDRMARLWRVGTPEIAERTAPEARDISGWGALSDDGDFGLAIFPPGGARFVAQMQTWDVSANRPRQNSARVEQRLQNARYALANGGAYTTPPWCRGRQPFGTCARDPNC